MARRGRRRLAAGAAGLLVAALSLRVAAAPGPAVINFQGRLVDNGALVNDADLSLRFVLYDADTGGTPLYIEDEDVAVVDGLYAALLGDGRIGGAEATLAAALARAGAQAWLGVTILGQGEFAPRTRLVAAPFALNTVAPSDLGPLAYAQGGGFVIVQPGASDVVNGQNLLAAYTAAAGIGSPNGRARAADNRVTLFVPPGRYDLQGAQLLLNAEFVDVVGLSAVREDQCLLGTTAGINPGVVRQTANDVQLANLWVRNTRTSGTFQNNASDPAAYYPDSNKPLTVVRNCRFDATSFARCTRTHIVYAGTYENCLAGDRSWGWGGTAAGAFRQCTAGDYSFGGAGTASGELYACAMTGTLWGGALTGTMQGCRWDAAVTTSGAGKVLESMVQGTWRHDGNVTVNGTIVSPSIGTLARKLAAGLVVVDATDNETTNGQNLIAAVAAAGALTPHGLARGPSNRVAVVVVPGRYNLGTGQVALSAEYVDLVGFSPVREHQYVFGTSAGAGSGVLRQTANDVRIENLMVECTRTSGSVGGPTSDDPAAYFPDTDKARTVVRNCRFLAAYDSDKAWSMRTAVVYAGRYERCLAGKYAFGGQGTAAGVFVDCQGGQYSFGGGGTASGTFVDCLGTPYSFGGASVGTGTASGTFRRCTYQNDDGTVLTVWGGVLTGRAEDLNWRSTLTVGNGASVYGGAVIGAIQGTGSGACRIAMVRCHTLNLGPTLTNLIVAPNNVINANLD